MKKLSIKVDRVLAILLLTISTVSSSFTSVNSVSATSVYDDSYQHTSSIIVNSIQNSVTACSNHDISTSWHSYITDSSKWQNPSDASNPSSAMSVARASFKAALDHGRWAISQRSAYSGSVGSYTNYVDILWAENTSMELVWAADHSVFASAPGMRYISIICGQSYGKGDAPVAFGPDIGSPGPISTALPYDPTPSSTVADDGIANFFAYTDDPNYPPDYEGASILADQQGSIISGNVQCADSSNIITNVGINVQSGVDGDAIITDDNNGGKNYRFYLWNESPYSLIVICDGDPFYGPTVDENLYSTYSWVCTPVSGIGVCAAS